MKYTWLCYLAKKVNAARKISITANNIQNVMSNIVTMA
jgi:hypothetical protein